MKGRNFSPSLYLSFVIQHFAKKKKEVRNKHVHICIGIQLIGVKYPLIQQQMYVHFLVQGSNGGGTFRLLFWNVQGVWSQNAIM